MRTFTLKNIPDGLYERLKASADKNRRSLNKEALVQLEKGLLLRQRDPQSIIEQVRKTRERLKFRITQEDIDEAKNWGRP